MNKKQKSVLGDSVMPTAEILHTPVIVAGFTGCGKSTLIAEVIRMAHDEDRFIEFRGRYMSRERRSGEIPGIHGEFITSEEFLSLDRQGEFFYSYQKYGPNLYGFSWEILLQQLKKKHVFIVGGELDTALRLKDELGKKLQEAFPKLPHKIRPIMIFINREEGVMMQSLMRRDMSDEEKKNRIFHLLQTWRDWDELNPPPKTDFVVWNDKSPMEGAKKLYDFLMTRVQKINLID